MDNNNLQQFYTEQEERMKIQDETFEDYAKRLFPSKPSATPSSSRLPHASFLCETPGNNCPDLVTAPTASGDESKITNAFVSTGRTQKRKESDFDAKQGPTQKQKTESHQDSDTNRVASDLRERVSSSALTKDPSSFDNDHRDFKSKEILSSILHESIDSFTIDGIVPPISPTSKQRKWMDTQRAQNKRHAISNRSPQPPALTGELSPILSFSQNTALPRKNDKAPSKMENVLPLEKPGLLFPLEGISPWPIRTELPVSKPDSDPTTSPIENSSLPSLSGGKRPLDADSSTLFLEMKERIAKQSGTKRDRVMKLPPKPVLLETDTSKLTAQVAESSNISDFSSPSSRFLSSPLQTKPKKLIMGPKHEMKVAQRPPQKFKAKNKRKTGDPAPLTVGDLVKELKANAVEVTKKRHAMLDGPLDGKKKGRTMFLSGKSIVYIGGDASTASKTTRGRMEIASIVAFGGNLMSEFDPDITTHIITDKNIARNGRLTVLKTLKLNKLGDIPDHIPTLNWEWVAEGMKYSYLPLEEVNTKLKRVYWSFASFGDRIDAGLTPQKARPIARKKNGEANTMRSISSTGGGAPSSFIIDNAYSTSSSNCLTDNVPKHRRKESLSPPSTPIHGTGRSRSAAISNGDGYNVSKNKDGEDPLAEFYEQARKEKLAEDGWSTPFEDVDSSVEETDNGTSATELTSLPTRSRKGWTCDAKEVQQSGVSPNQDIIDKLTELMELHKAKLGKENQWKVFSYNKSIRALRYYPTRIKNAQEARHIKGVGEKTALKIGEILQTGGLLRLNYENTQDVEVSRLFQGIYGVGKNIAFQWYQAGCQNLDDLKAGKGGVKLTPAQEIGLRYYDDINSRMPRDEARAIFDLIKPIALSIDPRLYIEIMGSYRRGKADCGDIDILITRPTDDGSTHSGVLPQLLRKLHSRDILTEDLALPDDPHDLEASYRGLCHLPDLKGSKRRRIDFLTVPWTSRGAALIYFTGDDIFNRSLRLKAGKLGYSLNQKGLFANVIRDPRRRTTKLESGVIVASETEEEIFKMLGVPWQEPHERIRG